MDVHFNAYKAKYDTLNEYLKKITESQYVRTVNIFVNIDDVYHNLHRPLINNEFQVAGQDASKQLVSNSITFWHITSSGVHDRRFMLEYLASIPLETEPLRMKYLFLDIGKNLLRIPIRRIRNSISSMEPFDRLYRSSRILETILPISLLSTLVIWNLRSFLDISLNYHNLKMPIGISSSLEIHMIFNTHIVVVGPWYLLREKIPRLSIVEISGIIWH